MTPPCTFHREVVHQIVAQTRRRSCRRRWENRGERELSRIRVDSSAAAASTTIFRWASRWALRGAIDIVDARGLRLILVHHQVAHHRVADQCEPARARCRGQRNGRAVEIRRGVASALAFVAVVARRTTLCGTVRFATRSGITRQPNLASITCFASRLAAGKIHGRKELAVRHLLQAFTRAAHADEAFDFVVVGFELSIVKGPVLPVAVAPGRLELVVAVAIALARPAERLAADLPAANPHEGLVWREGVGILMVVDEELVAVFVAGVAQSAARADPGKQRPLVAEAADTSVDRARHAR